MSIKWLNHHFPRKTIEGGYAFVFVCLLYSNPKETREFVCCCCNHCFWYDLISCTKMYEGSKWSRTSIYIYIYIYIHLRRKYLGKRKYRCIIVRSFSVCLANFTCSYASFRFFSTLSILPCINRHIIRCKILSFKTFSSTIKGTIQGSIFALILDVILKTSSLYTCLATRIVYFPAYGR